MVTKDVLKPTDHVLHLEREPLTLTHEKDDNEVNMDLTGANTFELKSRTKVFKNLISSFNVFTIWFTVFPSAAIVSPKPV